MAEAEMAEPRALTRIALAREVGDLAAAQLIARWGGHQLPRRTEQQVSRETRDASILADLKAGWTYVDTAERNQCSVATVWRVGKKSIAPAPPRE
jgi:Mor family transcriptional regulator